MAYYLEANEKWVKGYQRYYSVTDMGDFISHHYGSKEIRIINYRALKNGAFGATVGCSYNGRSKVINVAMAIYEAFVRPLKKGEILMPINGDVTDLRLENIMPMTDVPKEKTLCMSSGQRGRRPKEYVLENRTTGKLMYFCGLANAAQHDLNPSTLSSLISKATADGKNYFTLHKDDYCFLVA